MDANNFVMSSYQFVNSLASCYPNNNNSNANSGSGNGSQSDYFPGSAYTPNLYTGTPQSHYPNPQAYNPLAANTAAPATATQPGNSEMVDYTQLQPQKFMMNQQAMNPQSCKYATAAESQGGGGGGGAPVNPLAQTSISSPQDLSTARDISPKLSPNSVVETVTRSLNKQAAAHPTNNNNNSTTNNNNTTNSSNTNNSSNSHHHTTSLPMRSPDGDESDASSDSGTEGGSGTGGSGKKNPPQIYPWMKRVHIGTSKYF